MYVALLGRGVNALVLQELVLGEAGAVGLLVVEAVPHSFKVTDLSAMDVLFLAWHEWVVGCMVNFLLDLPTFVVRMLSVPRTAVVKILIPLVWNLIRKPAWLNSVA